MSSPDEVTVVWGEEKLSLKPYTSITVGPFFYKTNVQDGEKVADAFLRATRVVKFIAEKERTAKIDSYRKLLAECDE